MTTNDKANALLAAFDAEVKRLLDAGNEGAAGLIADSRRNLATLLNRDAARLFDAIVRKGN